MCGTNHPTKMSSTAANTGTATRRADRTG
jgi:hypothetical protein